MKERGDRTTELAITEGEFDFASYQLESLQLMIPRLALDADVPFGAHGQLAAFEMRS